MGKIFLLSGLSLDQLERLGFLVKSNSLQMMGKLEVDMWVFLQKIFFICTTLYVGSPHRDLEGGRGGP